MNDKLLFAIPLLIVLLYAFYKLCYNTEQFWGGYFPVPYMGQHITNYSRSGYDAATDDPKMIINIDDYPINPYCQRCKGYRCCCKKI